MARHPEALEVELEPPVIVVGLPRSGTTHLVNLLAADSRFRSMPWWEVAEPDPGDSATDPDPTASTPGTCGASPPTRSTRKIAPLASLMHDRPPVEHRGGVRAGRSRPLLLRPRVARPGTGLAGLLPGSGPARPLRLPAPGAAGAEPICGDRTAGCSRPPSTSSSWVRCWTTFPDATIAFTLRDPVAVLQSAITMLAYGDRLRRVHDRRRRTGRVLDRPHRAAAAGRRPGHPPHPDRAAGRRRVRRVHGRRPGHGDDHPRRPPVSRSPTGPGPS